MIEFEEGALNVQLLEVMGLPANLFQDALISGAVFLDGRINNFTPLPKTVRQAPGTVEPLVWAQNAAESLIDEIRSMALYI